MNRFDPMAELVDEIIEQDAEADEFYEQQRAEIEAENAWLRVAENANYADEPDWAL